MKRIVSCVAFAAACGSDAIDPDEVAQLVGTTIATPDGGGTVGAVADSLALAFGVMPAGFTDEPGLTSGMHGSIEHRYIMMVCRDRELRVLPTCTTETDSAVLASAWTGEHVQRSGMWSITNLQFWRPAIDGTSELALSGNGYEITATETENLLAPRHMIGGTLHLDLEVTHGVDHATMAADVYFDDTMRSAALLLDGHEYRVDLATGGVD